MTLSHDDITINTVLIIIIYWYGIIINRLVHEILFAYVITTMLMCQ